VQYRRSFDHRPAKSGHLNQRCSKTQIERPVGLTQPAIYSGLQNEVKTVPALRETQNWNQPQR
jgi:hypothetical protein